MNSVSRFSNSCSSIFFLGKTIIEAELFIFETFLLNNSRTILLARFRIWASPSFRVVIIPILTALFFVQWMACPQKKGVLTLSLLLFTCPKSSFVSSLIDRENLCLTKFLRIIWNDGQPKRLNEHDLFGVGSLTPCGQMLFDCVYGSQICEHGVSLRGCM